MTLPDGVTILIKGGGVGAGSRQVFVFRSDTLEWSQGKDMLLVHYDVRNTVTINGKIIFYAGGTDDKIYEYDPATEDFNEIGSWPGGPNSFAQGILYNKI